MGACLCCCRNVVTMINPTDKHYSMLVFSTDILAFEYKKSICMPEISVQSLVLPDMAQFHPFKGKNTHVLVWDFVEKKPVLYKRVKSRDTVTIGTHDTLPQSESDCKKLAWWAEHHNTPKKYTYVPSPLPIHRVSLGNGVYYIPD